MGKLSDLAGSALGAAVSSATKGDGAEKSITDVLSSAALSAITKQITEKASGISSSGLDLSNIVTTLVKSCSSSNIDYAKIANVVAQIFNAGKAAK